MVTFTCNNCGDSIKKARVEKHFSIECRRKMGGPNVCCIDCLKDFRQDYDAHTSCYTEDERYAAKGSFVAKDPKNKQKNKQLSWSEIIENVADSPGLIQPTKDILSILKGADNVPRKEAKFKNFCLNNGHLRRFQEKDIIDVFNMVQEEMKKNTEAAKKEKEEALAAAKKEKSETTANIKPVEDKAASKKRSIDNTVEAEENVPNKKMKAANVDSQNSPDESSKQKKKKNKKKKSSEQDVEMKPVQNVTEANADLTNEVKKKSKKKSKEQSTNMSKEVENGHKKVNGTINSNGIKPISNGNDESLTNGHSKSKKKKHSENKESVKEEEEEEEVGNETLSVDHEDVSVTSKSPKKKKKSLEPEKTPFKEVVAKLLKPGTEFKLKSLKKMVFAVYKSGEEEVPREVRENFNKKLLKIPNVEIHEKTVKMTK